VQRLAAVHHHTRSADKVARAIGAKSLDDVGQQASAATLSLSRKLIGRVALSLGQRSPLANCTMTHVPGPALPQYLCGARMTYDSAILPIADGMGLVFALTVYDGRVVLSPTSCRELMPDPEAFAQAVRDSFQDYLALARKAPAPTVKATAKRAAAVRAKAAAKPASPAKRPTLKLARAARPTPSGKPSRPARSA
jgi:hypothetical protein